MFLDSASIAETFGKQLSEALEDPKNAAAKIALMPLDEPNKEEPSKGGNGNGTPVDEIITAFAGIPFGTVTPKQAADPNAVMLTYQNYGDISFNGLDMNFTIISQSRVGV